MIKKIPPMALAFDFKRGLHANYRLSELKLNYAEQHSILIVGWSIPAIFYLISRFECVCIPSRADKNKKLLGYKA